MFRLFTFILLYALLLMLRDNVAITVMYALKTGLLFAIFGVDLMLETTMI